MGMRNGVMRRGTTNQNARGNTVQRRQRKIWLLATFSPELGPEQAWCSFGCGTVVDIKTVSVDRYPIAGCDGGTYRQGNIRPACLPCNSTHGSSVRRAKVGSE